MSRTRTILLYVLAAGLAAVNVLPLAWAQSGKRPPASAKTAKPPKWDKRVLSAFFEDARQKVGPGKPGGMIAGPATSTPGVAASSTANTPASSAVPAGGSGWSKLIDPDVLEAEIKSNINTLVPAVAVPGNFKSQTYKKARTAFSELAVLFGVVAEYDGDVKWKAKGTGLREALAKAAANCKVGTDQSHKEAKARTDSLKDLLDGNNIDIPAGEGPGEWGKVADLSELMKRMETAGQEHITPWTANAGDFNSNRDKIVHEAQVLAVLAQIIQHESYEYGGDESFRGHAAALQKACLEIAEGAKSGNAEKARTAAGDMAKACANCHTDFRQ